MYEYTVYTRNYCDCEKNNLNILTHLHLLRPPFPEYCGIFLKTRIVKPVETAVARERLCLLVCTVYSVLYSEIAVSRKLFRIGHMYIYVA
jgi:hypothetical protein